MCICIYIYTHIYAHLTRFQLLFCFLYVFSAAFKRTWVFLPDDTEFVSLTKSLELSVMSNDMGSGSLCSLCYDHPTVLFLPSHI